MAILTIPLGAFLAASALPIVVIVLAGLGFGILGFLAIATGINAALAIAQSSYGGLGGTTAALVGLAGFGEAFGIVAGAYIMAAVIASRPRLSTVTA